MNDLHDDAVVEDIDTTPNADESSHSATQDLRYANHDFSEFAETYMAESDTDMEEAGLSAFPDFEHAELGDSVAPDVTPQKDNDITEWVRSPIKPEPGELRWLDDPRPDHPNTQRGGRSLSKPNVDND